MPAGSSDPARAARQRLESLARAGVQTIPKPRAKPTPTPPVPTAPATKVAAAPAAIAATPVTPPVPFSLTETSRSASLLPATPDAPANDSLDIIRAEVVACTRCSELVANRTQTVFGVGNPRARLCFLGEAPGADEDRQGEPFVGRAGQLLNKIIEACTLRREDVYILNICKCRPPGNRTPLPDEAANCRGYLDRQLALIQPEYICCLGACAAQNLLGVTTPIGKMRGKVLDLGPYKVVCTWHPAYLLRNPAAKRDTWDDMQMLMKLMGIPLPGRD